MSQTKRAVRMRFCPASLSNNARVDALEVFSWLSDRKLQHVLQVYVQLSFTKTRNLMEMRKPRRPERSAGGLVFM